MHQCVIHDILSAFNFFGVFSTKNKIRLEDLHYNIPLQNGIYIINCFEKTINIGKRQYCYSIVLFDNSYFILNFLLNNVYKISVLWWFKGRENEF